ncbi:hypothetical protein AMECASPLE_020360 [Ameca splendens]|uniref:Uncharacterized protein n=1 Tax=Ameca splendens TaxID=208324 RepID=A0ABV0XG94_9TELE
MLTLQCPGFSCQSESESHPLCSTLPCTHTLTHTHSGCPEEIGDKSEPCYGDMYACTQTQTLLPDSDSQRHLLKRVFDGSRMTHYVHSYNSNSHTQPHTNKQTN